ncbi:MAG: sigma-70 family RNA polymerase sigma factor [Bacteroidia bacterium]|nr:sigma-70 family RNA polymerase sigma factor [Bacteroidia bacterium]
MKKYSDQDILDCLRKKPDGCNDQLSYLYWKLFPQVKGFLLQNQGGEEDAQDALQEGIIALWRSVMEGRFREESTISTFVLASARFFWLNKLKTKDYEHKFRESQDLNVESENKETELIKMEKDTELKKKVRIYLEKMGDTCRKVLEYGIIYKWTMEDIAAEMDYKSEQIARNALMKCKKRLRELLQGEMI